MQDKSVRAAWYLGANKCRPSLLNATRWSLEGHYHWWETRHTEIAITPMVRTVQHTCGALRAAQCVLKTIRPCLHQAIFSCWDLH